MLRRATPADAGTIEALWTAPQNAMWIEPPDPGEIDTAIAAGLAFLWEPGGTVTGFAQVMTWVPRVYGLSALCVTQPGQGEPLLRAVLAQVFGPLNAHRIGFDVTIDNTRALRLYRKLGFQTEGQIRECWQRADGRFVDCLLLGLLRREWQP
ncbi:MAG: GNAT family N-acetyltransferase [Tabrizicola sp.]